MEFTTLYKERKRCEMNDFDYKNIVDEWGVFIFKDTLSKEDVLHEMVNAFQNHNIVKETFEKALYTREEVFPTGLDFNGTGIAIPHTDSEHVLETKIGIGVLKEPINFKAMGGEGEVSVRIVVMLAIADKGQHMTLLKDLMTGLQDLDCIEDLLSGNSQEEIRDSFIAMLEKA